MHHLFLLAPLLALPVFRLMPAAPVASFYAFIAAVSGVLYWFVFWFMRRSETTEAEPVLIDEPLDNAHYQTRSHGEF